MDRKGRDVEALRANGALFVYVFGSVARGEETPASDLDIAALFPEPAPQAFDLEMPPVLTRSS